MTANATLKARHTEYLCIGLLLAVMIHAIAFAFWPEYVPRIYKPREASFEILPPPEVFVIPPRPPEVKPPERPVEIAPSDDADEDDTIPPNLFDRLADMPVLPPPPPPVTEDFFAFDKEPELIEAAKPEYPDIARKAGVEGRVAVWVVIDEEGRVISAEIASSDAPILNQACLEAAYRHRFTPAYQRDVPVKSKISLRFRFVLND
jgi:protein TonB